MSTTGTHRRGFLSTVTAALLAVIGLLMLIPAIRYLFAPLWRKRGAGGQPTFVDVGHLADIPIGEWRLVAVERLQEDGWRKSRTRYAVWVRRQGPGDEAITVLTSICPHLGCPINWHPDRSQFECPCHRGLFDSTGIIMGGPPPRSMDPLEFEVRAGRLWVRWQDFKIGVPDRIAVSV
jgi:Rieske Fe-S protein